MLRVADYVMERLHSAGVQHIFMVTGRGALFLTDAVARLKAISPICMHHEQSASFAAAAYAQQSGALGVCLVSTGCASTNAVTGVLSAWQDNLPCIFISGQNTLRETTRFTGKALRTYGQQEADIVSIVESVTKYAVMIDDPASIAYELDKAIFLASSGRPGPVWIDIPLDIQSMRVDSEMLVRFAPESAMLPSPSDEDVQFVAETLQKVSRPVLLIGSGIRSAKAIDSLKAFLAKNPMPVVYTGSAPDIVDGDNPLVVGSVGAMGCSRAGNFAVQNSDLLLVVGCRLSSLTTGTDFEKFARSAKIVVVDIDPIEHSKDGVRIDRFVAADANQFLIELAKNVRSATADTWIEKCHHWKSIFPRCEPEHRQSERVDLYHLAECLSQSLPQDASLVTDSGFAEVILPTNVAFSDGQRCIHPVSQGAMGYALPAIVGAFFASGRPVVAVVGDGSVMMNIQELQTISHHGIPAKILIISNGAYAIIRRRQKDLFRTRTIGTDPSNGVTCPDFSEIARAFRLPYVRIDDSLDLEARIASVLSVDGPMICEVQGIENQIYIETSLAKNANGRLVRRPIEDQAPFLARETFLSEMMVEPIDQ